MHEVVALDTSTRTVTVDAGITYTQLCPWLDRRGFALHNLASLTDIRVAGAISTATHGMIRAMDMGCSHSRRRIPYFGATLATHNLHPAGLNFSAETVTQQLGVPGPWYEHLPHFRPGTTASVGNELQSEYFVPREHALDVILAVEALGGQISPHLFISEIRTIAGDELWMSPAYRLASVAIHFTWRKNVTAVRALLPRIEFRPRPHWGKLFALPRRS